METVLDRHDVDRNAAVVRRLVAEHVLSPAQADVVLAALRAAEPRTAGRGWWVEVFGYVGGGLMLAGAATLVGLSWDQLSRTGQVGMLAAIALALTAAGLIIARGPAGLYTLGAARRRIVSVLFALTAGVVALAAGVAVDNRPEIVAPVVGLLVAVAGYALVRAAPGLLATAAFAVFATLSTLDVLVSSALVSALALISLGVLAMALALGDVLRPRPLGIGVAATIALIGGQQPVGTDAYHVWAYLLTAVVAIGCLALYQRERSALLLIAGVLGITIAVPEAVWDLTDGAGGAAAILLVTGAVLVATSVLGMRMHGRSRTAP